MYRSLRRLIPAALAMAATLASPPLPAEPVAAQGTRALPFAPGDQCVYRGSGVLGRIGTGVMAVDGPEQVDGRERAARAAPDDGDGRDGRAGHGRGDRRGRTVRTIGSGGSPAPDVP